MSSVPTDNISGTKRKRGQEPKFYAVKIGAKPGIYYSWPDCLEQVKGFKNATFKSFPTLAEAESFLSGETSALVSRSSTAGQKFYAVQNGRTPGVYLDWPSAQAQILGWSKPKFKSFSTRFEAEAFVKQSVSNTQDVSMDPKAKIQGPVSKKQKKTPSGTDNQASGNSNQNIEPGYDFLPPGSTDGFDHRLILNPEAGKIEYRTEAQQRATKMHAVGPADGAMLHIYTDGSALGNGANGATAGVGVYFGPQDPRNVSEALSGMRQTNQRAELTAIQRALEISPRNRDVTIYSDSDYAIKCVTVWFQGWRRNGWITASKKPVENKDLIELVVGRIEERMRCKAKTLFQWVKGHANEPGNVAADQLAVSGARAARVPAL